MKRKLYPETRYKDGHHHLASSLSNLGLVRQRRGDQAEAERLCSRIGFLARGKLVAEGTATELMRHANAATLDDAFITLTGEELKPSADYAQVNM